MLLITKSTLIILLFSVGFMNFAYAHTVDSVGEYRLEIGWMNEPVVSGETNGIELFVSPLEDGLPLEEQTFHDGIKGLEKTLKMELVYKTEKIKLSLSKDHNIPGKYYAFVDPTVSGFYQANVLGTIGNTTVSLSMHPPKVDERKFIEFPEPSDVTLQQIIAAHTTIVGDINELKIQVNELKQKSQSENMVFAGLALAMAGIAIAVAIVALARTRKN